MQICFCLGTKNEFIIENLVQQLSQASNLQSKAQVYSEWSSLLAEKIPWSSKKAPIVTLGQKKSIERKNSYVILFLFLISLFST